MTLPLLQQKDEIVSFAKYSAGLYLSSRSILLQ